MLSDSVENIIEQIAQKTEKQQREISQKKPITTIDEEQMVITAEEEIKTAVKKAIKSAVKKNQKDIDSNKNSLGS